MSIRIINETKLDKDLLLYFQGDPIKYAWLEHSNKHLPIMFPVEVVGDNCLCIKECVLEELMKLDAETEMILSISDDAYRMEYEVYPLLENVLHKRLFIGFGTGKVVIKTIDVKGHFGNSPTIRHKPFNRTINILVVGTCFSRRTFISKESFNPNYKEYFNVSSTVFHNSLISIFSSPLVGEDYLDIEDLKPKNVAEYVEMEFEKNFFDHIDGKNIDYIIFDNYMDATTPVISYKGSYITYDKYISESIFKRKLIGCDVVYPDSEEHKRLLKEANIRLQEGLAKRGLEKRIILLGARLSKEYYDIASDTISAWPDDNRWIEDSNKNWDIADEIFLEVNKEARYIDMTNTSWLSQKYMKCGKASPSHYETGFYREIMQKILDIVEGDNNV